MGSWALALARLFGFQLRWQLFQLRRCCHGLFLGHLDFDGPQLLFPAGGPLLLAPLAVAARLLPTTILSPFAGPELLATLPAPPARGFPLAGGTAIALLWLIGMERAFTSLQQTEPLSIVATGLLRRPRREGILEWAHGSSKPTGSSLGGELVLDSEAFLLAHPIQHSEGSTATRRRGRR
jgi:hypothetical protein